MRGETISLHIMKFKIYKLNGKHPPIKTNTPCVIIGNYLVVPEKISDYVLTTPKTLNAPIKPDSTQIKKMSKNTDKWRH